MLQIRKLSFKIIQFNAPWKFFLGSLASADKPKTIDHLVGNILRVIPDTLPQRMKNVIESWTTNIEKIQWKLDFPFKPVVVLRCQKSYSNLKCQNKKKFFKKVEKKKKKKSLPLIYFIPKFYTSEKTHPVIKQFLKFES